MGTPRIRSVLAILATTLYCTVLYCMEFRVFHGCGGSALHTTLPIEGDRTLRRRHSSIVASNVCTRYHVSSNSSSMNQTATNVL